MRRQLIDEFCILPQTTLSQYYYTCSCYKWGPFGRGGNLVPYLGYVRNTFNMCGDMTTNQSDSALIQALETPEPLDQTILFISYPEITLNSTIDIDDSTDSQETIIWRGDGWLHNSVHMDEGVDIHNLSAIETIHDHTPNISIHFEENEEDVTFIGQINRLNSTFSFF